LKTCVFRGRLLHSHSSFDYLKVLRATITGPQQDLNLGITTYVNGPQMSPVQIDTSTAATDTIDYVATDQPNTHASLNHAPNPYRLNPKSATHAPSNSRDLSIQNP
jgi:hypothetical protein